MQVDQPRSRCFPHALGRTCGPGPDTQDWLALLKGFAHAARDRCTRGPCQTERRRPEKAFERPVATQITTAVKRLAIAREAVNRGPRWGYSMSSACPWVLACTRHAPLGTRVCRTSREVPPSRLHDGASHLRTATDLSLVVLHHDGTLDAVFVVRAKCRRVVSTP